MKKLLAVLLMLCVLFLAACTENEEEQTQAETHPQTEITTEKPVPFEEKTPATCDTTLPEGIAIRLRDIDFDSFTEISAEDSIFPDAGHDKILENANSQFFFVEGDTRVHGVFFDENKNVAYAASYNNGTGYVEFMGNDTKSWYFDEEGGLYCVVFTYYYENKNTAPIYTFYNAQGEKEAIRTMGGWYTPELDLLDDERAFEFINRYSGTIEATAEY